MRIGEVIGTVTLSRRLEEIAGERLLIVQPHSAAVIRDGAAAGGEPVVACDGVSAGLGSVVGFSEGREAAMPFHPRLVPVDAYCAAILDRVHIEE
ncbi:MAG: EutN/CcmL family microcompartment protein [bacterium]|nr:EutN/CcmL family microcompartment protein [bacterium]